MSLSGFLSRLKNLWQASRPSAQAPGLDRAAQQKAQERIIFEDSQLLVVNKPAGISSVPYERDEKSTAMDLIRDAWRAQGRKATDQPLYVVHRIDKDTSGLLMFAKTRPAERELQQLFRHHDIRRRYLCVAHGYCISRTIEKIGRASCRERVSSPV